MDLTRDQLKFSEAHAYVLVDEDRGFVGLSEVALQRLGEVVFVELPEVGEPLVQGESFATVESAEGSLDVVSPVTGVVLGINTQLAEEPEVMNASTYTDGWLVEVQLEAPEELESLMEIKQYEHWASA